MKKERLDKFLTDLGYFETKSKASASILAGHVKIDDEYITKSGYQINIEKEHDIKVKTMPYVSRGGFKLQRALECFPINIKNRFCIDAGASTGGFTDCLLQNGAQFVYAVDVGYGQLDWKIRSDKRVKTIERTNLKICQYNDIYSNDDIPADLLVSDLSFISLTKVMGNFKTLLKPEFNEMICLIKPQFEAGKDKVEKGGVVKDPKTHIQVIKNVIDCANELNYFVNGLTYSSIKGPSGNIEYLIWLSSEGQDCNYNIEEITEQAFTRLN